MIGRPMFDYVALVDAPVQRFTGIVTGPDPLDELVRPTPSSTEASLARILAVAAPVVAGPSEASDPFAERRTVAEPQPIPEPRDVAEPEPISERQPIRPVAPPAARSAAARPVAPTTPPAILPALVAVAAASLTAVFWLRRDGHHRPR